MYKLDYSKLKILKSFLGRLMTSLPTIESQKPDSPRWHQVDEEKIWPIDVIDWLMGPKESLSYDEQLIPNNQIITKAS